MGKQTRKTKMLSFTEKDFGVYEHLMQMTNASEYVINLIKSDIENNTDESYKIILMELQEIKTMLHNGSFQLVDKSTTINPIFKDKMVKVLDVIFDDE